MGDPSDDGAATNPDDADIDELPGEFNPGAGDSGQSLLDEIDALPDLDEDDKKSEKA